MKQHAAASAALKTLDSHGLAPVLGKVPQSIQADLSRAPHRLPPPIMIDGARGALWLESTVLDWLLEQQRRALTTKRKAGRPTKVAQQVRREAAAMGGQS
ncbi:MAG: hypothetical protein JOY60_01870 [Burkholderiaceae bacterium]|nr:hypothetical protein [Burkholderiaceae bacterium]